MERFVEIQCNSEKVLKKSMIFEGNSSQLIDSVLECNGTMRKLYTCGVLYEIYNNNFLSKLKSVFNEYEKIIPKFKENTEYIKLRNIVITGRIVLCPGFGNIDKMNNYLDLMSHMLEDENFSKIFVKECAKF
jgi:hypothetical protein